jgi:hypothetical protein
MRSAPPTRMRPQWERSTSAAPSVSASSTLPVLLNDAGMSASCRGGVAAQGRGGLLGVAQGGGASARAPHAPPIPVRRRSR